MISRFPATKRFALDFCCIHSIAVCRSLKLTDRQVLHCARAINQLAFDTASVIGFNSRQKFEDQWIFCNTRSSLQIPLGNSIALFEHVLVSVCHSNNSLFVEKNVSEHWQHFYIGLSRRCDSKEYKFSSFLLNILFFIIVDYFVFPFCYLVFSFDNSFFHLSFSNSL